MHAAERALIKQLLAFPVELESAAERRAPHRIAAYALELAQGFTAFYRDCRVVGAEPESVESFAHRVVRGEQAHDRPLPGPARGERARGDVAVERPGTPRRSSRTRRPQSNRAGSASRRAASVALIVGAGAIRGAHLRTGPPAPAWQQHRERRQQRQERGDGHQIGG